MMQGFYLLAVQRAHRRMAAAVLACLAAATGLVLAGRARSAAAAAPANAAVSYTVRSESDRLIVRRSDGSVLRTAIDTRTLPAADREALHEGIVLENADELARLLEDYSS